ncbi:MAG: hypothetical protein QM539_04430 [Alphaproteobacteria bacterium]|nr:hypothetical protein [Alphaproteobacteria bacterium]
MPIKKIFFHFIWLFLLKKNKSFNKFKSSIDYSTILELANAYQIPFSFIESLEQSQYASKDILDLIDLYIPSLKKSNKWKNLSLGYLFNNLKLQTISKPKTNFNDENWQFLNSLVQRLYADEFKEIEQLPHINVNNLMYYQNAMLNLVWCTANCDKSFYDLDSVNSNEFKFFYSILKNNHISISITDIFKQQKILNFNNLVILTFYCNILKQTDRNFKQKVINNMKDMAITSIETADKIISSKEKFLIRYTTFLIDLFGTPY